MGGLGNDRNRLLLLLRRGTFRGGFDGDPSMSHAQITRAVTGKSARLTKADKKVLARYAPKARGEQ